MVGLFLACDFEGAPAYSILEEIRTSARQRASHLRRTAGRLERDQEELGGLLGSFAQLRDCRLYVLWLGTLRRRPEPHTIATFPFC